MSFPVLHLSGGSYEQGRRHGEALKYRVAHNVNVYFDRFQRETKLPRADVLEMAGCYAAAIKGQNADYHAAMRGVAEGAGFSLEEIAALNVRYEILYYQFGALAMEGERAAREAMPDGCTAFAVLPEASANGHLLLGQNWDWIPQVQGAVLHTTDADGTETLAFTEAGIVGAKIGFNDAGIGLCVNGMTTTDDDWSRLRKPFHVRCYEILRSRTFDAAVRVITHPDRSCSTNFLIAQPPGNVADVEAAPNTVRVVGCENGRLVHTNHFLDPGGMGVTEPPSERRPYSRHRRARMMERLDAQRPISVAQIQAALQDHVEKPFSICRHEDWSEPPEEHYITVTSAIMDLDARTLSLTDGPPCENAPQTVRMEAR